MKLLGKLWKWNGSIYMLAGFMSIAWTIFFLIVTKDPERSTTDLILYGKVSYLFLTCWAEALKATAVILLDALDEHDNECEEK